MEAPYEYNLGNELPPARLALTVITEQAAKPLQDAMDRILDRAEQFKAETDAVTPFTDNYNAPDESLLRIWKTRAEEMPQEATDIKNGLGECVQDATALMAEFNYLALPYRDPTVVELASIMDATNAVLVVLFPKWNNYVAMARALEAERYELHNDALRAVQRADQLAATSRRRRRR